MPDDKLPSLEAYTQGLPYNLEAEQSVLGCVLLDPEKLPDIMEKIASPEVFYNEQHKKLYALMIRMFSESRPIDYITLLEKARGEEIFDNDATAKSYLLHLMELVPTTSNLSNYCDIVLEKYYMRNLLSAATEIESSVRQGEGSASELLDAAEQKIYDIRQGRQSSELRPISEVIIGVYDNIYEMNQKDDTRITGLASGFTQLDLILSGLNRSDLILVAARPGMGKSAFALNIAANVGIKHPDMVEQARRLGAASCRNAYLAGRYRRYFGSADEGEGAAAEKSRADYHRLSSADDQFDPDREPRAGDLPDDPRTQDHGQGTGRSGYLPVSALPRRRTASGTPPDAFRPARIRLDRTGRRQRSVPFPRGILCR